MKRTQNLILLSVLLIAISIPYANANEYESPTKPYPKPHYKPPKTTANVVVEGIVYCQSCKYSGTWSLDEAKPIEGAKIGVICRNYKDRISYYKTYSTDSGGYFYAKLDGFTMRHQLLDHPLQACVVKLVSSPIDECDVFTNINYGVNGAALRYEKKKIMNKGYEAVIYAAGPLAFRPEYCIVILVCIMCLTFEAAFFKGLERSGMLHMLRTSLSVICCRMKFVFVYLCI